MPDTNILKGKGVYSSNDHNCKWPDEEKCIYNRRIGLYSKLCKDNEG